MKRSVVVDLVKRSLPTPLRRLGGRQLSRWSNFRSLKWLGTFSPELSTNIQQWRHRSMGGWLEKHRPDIYSRLFGNNLPQVIRDHFLAALASEPYRRVLGSDQKRGSNIEADVLYFSPDVRPDVIKELVALKSIDPKLHCVLLSWPGSLNEKWARQYVRLIIHDYYWSMAMELMNAQARVLLVRSGGDRIHGVLARLFWDGRMIYRPGELALRMPRGALSDLEYMTEKYVVEHADGMYTTHPVEAVESLKGEIDLRCPVLSIGPLGVSELGPSSMLPKLSSMDGQIHLVFAAGLPRRGDTLGRAVEIESSYEKWAKVVDQGLHLHVYCPSISSVGYEEYYRLAKRSPFFHIEKPLPYNELLTELTKYDWGFSHFSVQNYPIRPGFVYLTNNFYTFIQSGLPIICSSANVEKTRLARELGFGLAISDDEIGQLRSRIEGFPRDGLNAVLERAKKVLSFDREALYNLVLSDRKP